MAVASRWILPLTLVVCASALAEPSAAATSDSVTLASVPPSADQIMAACMTVQVPAALKQLGINPHIRTREDAGAFAHAVCREFAGHCASAPTSEACKQELSRLGLVTGAVSPSPGAALFDAARVGAESSLRKLLAEGVDANWRGLGGWTPLMIAAAEKHAVAVELLLAAKADPNLRNSYGRTALMYAANYGQTEIVRKLLAAGADPNITPTDATGWTALIAASAQGHAAVVEALLKAGADPRIKARDGQRAIDLARSHSHRPVVGLLEAVAARP